MKSCILLLVLEHFLTICYDVMVIADEVNNT